MVIGRLSYTFHTAYIQHKCANLVWSGPQLVVPLKQPEKGKYTYSKPQAISTKNFLWATASKTIKDNQTHKEIRPYE